MQKYIIIIFLIFSYNNLFGQLDSIPTRKVLIDIEYGFYTNLGGTLSDTIIKKTYRYKYLEITYISSDTISIKEIEHNTIRSERKYAISNKLKSKRLKTFDSTTFEPSRERIFYYKLKPVGTWIFYDDYGYKIRTEKHK